MNILEFIKKYEYTKVFNGEYNKEFKNDLNSLLINSKENKSLVLTFHTLLESYFPFEILKDVINYDEKGKEEILTNENTFKWSCAFGNKYLLLYLNDKIKEENKHIASSVNAAIMQYRVDNIQALSLMGYEKEVFTEPAILQSISRSQQTGAGLNIVDYYFKNKQKWKMTPYIDSRLEECCFYNLSSMINYEHTFDYFFNKYRDIKNEKIAKDIPEIINKLIFKNKIENIDIFYKSIYKNEVINYFKKPQLMLNNLRLDYKNEDSLLREDENKLNKIIEAYPELIKADDIKLWMMNDQSLNLKRWIEEKRKLKTNEIKKSFIDLSANIFCFEYLISKININKVKFNLAESVKLLNNYYEQIKYDEIDYSIDSKYVELGKKLLVKENFYEYKEELKAHIYDEKLLDIISKEIFKNQLENKLESKKETKKLKI